MVPKKSNLLETFSWMTALIIVIAIIIVIVGAIQVIRGVLTYDQWVNFLWKFALGIAGTAIGRGIARINK